jgi:hypothetical protein
MNPEYMPATLEGKLVHLIEECSEVQKTVCKTFRFGLENFHPNDPAKQSNQSRLLAEMIDLEHAITIVRREIAHGMTDEKKTE